MDVLSNEATVAVAVDGGPERAVLVVDDEPSFRDLLTTLFAGAGYVVHAVADGRAALGVLAAHRVDIVVTDLCMPGIDGMELLMQLRGLRSHVPIIAISGGASGHRAGLLRAARLLGARRTLAKPFHLQELAEIVRETLAGGNIK